MQVQNAFIEDLKPLKYCFIFHFILYILIFILHLVLYNRLYWLNKIFKILFTFITYFVILFYIIPLIQFILLCKKYYKLKLFRFFKYLSFIFFILSIIIGLITCVILWINTFYSVTFCKECPLSYTIANLNYTFYRYYGKRIKNEKVESKCNTKRCLLFNEDINEKYAYTYLCNYEVNYKNDNSNKNEYKRMLPNGTELISDIEFNCYYLEPTYRQISFNSNIYYNYLDICSYCTNFYICERFSEPKNYYMMKKNEECPEDNYLILLYIISCLIIVTDIIISLLPWFIEYISFKKILFINENNSTVSSASMSTKKSTTNSNSNSNNAENFKKEETIIIVRPLNLKENKNEEDKKIQKNINNEDIKELDNALFGEIHIHNIEKKNIKEDIKEIKIKKFNIKNKIGPLIIEESDRNYFNSHNEDFRDIPTCKNNNYIIDDENIDRNNNLINLKKNKNEKKQ